MSIEVRIKVTPPVAATREEIQEWVEYCTGYCGGISEDNPLCEYDMQADDVDVYD